MRTWREWVTSEIRYLRHHYPAGTPVNEISRHIGRSEAAVKRKALDLGLRHPGHSSAQLIENFEKAHGKPLCAIAQEYQDRRLSRRDLAHDIGIERLALKNALSDEMWQSWPRMTIGRKDACASRRKAA